MARLGLLLLLFAFVCVCNSQTSSVRSWEDILLIDDFSTPQSITATGYNFEWNTAEGDGILGHARLLDIIALEAGVIATCEVSDGVLLVSSPDTGFNVDILWVGTDGDGLGVDFSEGIGIRMRVKSANPMRFALDLCSGDGGHECSQQNVDSVSGQQYQDIFFAFSKLSAVDFTNVNEITLTIGSSQGHSDIFVKSISVVAAIEALPDFVFVFDDFSATLPMAEMDITSDPTPASPAVLARNIDDTSIVGGERNQAIVVTMPGYPGHTGSVSMEVADMGLAVDMGIFEGYLLLQYDGEDGVTSMDGPNLLFGLGGIDGTANGQAEALRVSVGGQQFLYSPYTASLRVYIYDTNGRVGSVQDVSVAPLGEVLDFWFPFSAFGMVDIESIAAVEVMLDLARSSSNIYVTDVSFVGVGGGSQGCAAAVPIGDGHFVLSNVDGMVYENLCGLDTQAGMVWLSYVPAETGSLFISSCDENTAIDTVIAVVADCQSLGCIIANDDAPCQFPGGERTSSCSVNVNQGQQYFIAVGGYGSYEGPIGVTVELLLALGSTVN